MISNCRDCEGKHKKQECPAFGKECLLCHKKNHWAEVCMVKKRGMRGKAVHCLGEEEDDMLFFNVIASGKETIETPSMRT